MKDNPLRVQSQKLYTTTLLGRLIGYKGNSSITLLLLNKSLEVKRFKTVLVLEGNHRLPNQELGRLPVPYVPLYNDNGVVVVELSPLLYKLNNRIPTILGNFQFTESSSALNPIDSDEDYDPKQLLSPRPSLSREFRYNNISDLDKSLSLDFIPSTDSTKKRIRPYN